MKLAREFFVSITLVFLEAGCRLNPEAALKKSPDFALTDINNNNASSEQRRQWVIALKAHNRRRFEEDYGVILNAKTIQGKEALQIAYLFFYSSGQICGYVENLIQKGDLWHCAVNVVFLRTKQNTSWWTQKTVKCGRKSRP